MLDRRLVYFIASDTHDPVRRSPRLDEAFDAVTERYGTESARALFVENPAAVLTGDQLDFDPPSALSTKRKWYQFW